MAKVSLIESIFEEDDGKAGQSQNLERLPKWVVYVTVLVTLLPGILNFWGIDFSFRVGLENLRRLSDQALVMQQMKGISIHTILEWVAVTTAGLTAGLAFVHYLMKREPMIPVVCMALLSAGIMDAFHVLAATGVISTVAPQGEFTLFSWTLSRIFNSLICMIGVAVLIKKSYFHKKNMSVILSIGVIFLFLSYLSTYMAANSHDLPKMTYMGSLIIHPWDLIPLLFFAINLVIYKQFFSMRPSPFTHALILSCIPNIVCQLHMAFGSETLQDSHSNIAHFLKAVSYLLPFIGIAFEYIRTHQDDQKKEATNAQIRKLASLGQLAGCIGHEINNPLSVISGHASIIQSSSKKGTLNEEKIATSMDKIQESVGRISNTIIEFRKQATQSPFEEFADHNIVRILYDTVNLCQERFKNHAVKIYVDFNRKDTINVYCRKIEISQVLMSILNNSLENHEGHGEEEEPCWVKVGINNDTPNFVEVTVEDSSVRETGSDLYYEHEIGKQSIGLATCRDIMEAHEGYLYLDVDKEKHSKVTLGFVKSSAIKSVA